MAEKTVGYEYDGRRFEGKLVYDETVTAKRPAILMQPDWLGVCAHSLEMAHEVAGKDYVVMLADMWGAGYGEREKTFDELMKISREVRADVTFLRGCGATAYAVMTAEADALGLIDTGKKGAIGFCIGGGFALEHARNGADFQGTVVLHVTLPNPVDTESKPNIKGRVLALHGAADPVTPRDQMDALEDEMTEAGVDWQVMMFGHAVHSFCDKDQGWNHPGLRYDEKVKNKSYRMMREFFAETW
jgi:dienelactone hydrolase